MQFEGMQSVWFFWSLPMLIGFYLLFQARRKTILFAFVNRLELKTKLPLFNVYASLLQFILFLFALFFFGIALLKPYAGFELHEVKRKGIDLYLLVDLSTSMLAQDIKPNRLERAKREIKDFISTLKGDRLGLIGFSGLSFVFVPLTVDDEALGLFVNELSTDLIPTAGTDIKGAIAKAVESFKKQSLVSSKAIVLITDGEDSVGLNEAVIKDIQEIGIKVFVMGVGSTEGAPIPMHEGDYKKDAEGNVVLTRLNEQALTSLAVATGGGYVRSISGDLDLKEIYTKGIKQAFDAEDLSKTEKKLPNYRFQLPLILGTLFLIMEILTTTRRRFWLRLFTFGKLTAVGLIFMVFLSRSAEAKNPFGFEGANEIYTRGDPASSLQKYLDLKKSDPYDPDLNYNLGNNYYRLNEHLKAEESYKQALNSNDEELRKLALYNLGNTAYRQQKLDEALDYYDKALKIDPNYQKAKLNYEFVKKQKDEQEKQQQQNKDQEKLKQNGQEPSEDKQDQTKKDEGQDNQDQYEGEGQNPEDQNQNQQDQSASSGQKKTQGQQNQEGQDSNKKEDAGQKPNPDNLSEQGLNNTNDENDDAQKSVLATPGKFDNNADQWLDSLNDDPTKALKKMIQQKTQKNRGFDKDW